MNELGAMAGNIHRVDAPHVLKFHNRFGKSARNRRLQTSVFRNVIAVSDYHPFWAISEIRWNEAGAFPVK